MIYIVNIKKNRMDDGFANQGTAAYFQASNNSHTKTPEAEALSPKATQISTQPAETVVIRIPIIVPNIVVASDHPINPIFVTWLHKVFFSSMTLSLYNLPYLLPSFINIWKST